MDLRDCTMVPVIHRECLLVRAQNEDVQTNIWRKFVTMPWILDQMTHSWSPLKSPNATTRPSPLNPKEPASINEFPLKRFGGNGQMATVGKTRQATTIKSEVAVAPLRRPALSKGIMGFASAIYASKFVGSSSSSVALCTSVMTRQQPQQCLFNDVAMLSDSSCFQPQLDL